MKTRSIQKLNHKQVGEIENIRGGEAGN